MTSCDDLDERQIEGGEKYSAISNRHTFHANLPSRACDDCLFAFQTTTPAGIDARAHVEFGPSDFLQEKVEKVSEGRLGRVLEIFRAKTRRQIGNIMYDAAYHLGRLIGLVIQCSYLLVHMNT